MSTWKLTLDGETQTFEAWKFAGLQVSEHNQAEGYASWEMADCDFDDDVEFEAGDIVTILKDDETWFVGRMREPKRVGEGTSEKILFYADSMSWFLENLVFRQGWKFLTNSADPESGLATTYTARLILFQKTDGSLANISEQIQEIVNYAIGKGAPIALDTSTLPTHQAPFVGVTNRSCADCIRLCLLTCPDASLWWDYSEETPTLKIARRASQTPVTLTSDTVDISGIALEPLAELVKPAVVIEYEQANTVNGRSWRSIDTDVFPVAADQTAFGVLPEVVSLEGENLTFPVETLVCEAIAFTTDQQKIDFFKAHCPELAKANVTGITIRAATRTGALTNELKPNGGSWAPWMGGSAEEATFEAYLSYSITETVNGVSVVREKVYDELKTVRIMTTDKESGTYTGAASGDIGEPRPTGLAQALYEASSVLHYAGTITLDEEECSDVVGIGNVVNITGYRSEWATMRAQVQAISKDVDSGRTTITVGPPKHLGAADIMEWLRGVGQRVSRVHYLARTVGYSPTNGALQMASRTSKEAMSAGIAVRERLVLCRPDSANNHTANTLTARIILDILDCGGKELKIREMDICDATTGEIKKVRLLCSVPY